MRISEFISELEGKCPECEKKQRIIDNIAHHLGEILISMQAAYIEMHKSNAEKAMGRIESTLGFIQLIPRIQDGKTAQEFFDEEIAKLESRRRNESYAHYLAMSAMETISELIKKYTVEDLEND